MTNVKIKKWVNGVLVDDIDQNMPSEQVKAFVAPYESVTAFGVKVEIKINPINN